MNTITDMHVQQSYMMDAYREIDLDIYSAVIKWWINEQNKLDSWKGEQSS